jgi:hypothetical protein
MESVFVHGIALGDLDGDGDVDAFVADGGIPNGADQVWLNDGAGNLTDSGQRLGSSTSLDVALGDLDGDGDLDAFVGNEAMADEVWLNRGDGFFVDTGQRLGLSDSEVVALGDLDGDRDLDAYVASHPHMVWLNDGAGSFVEGGRRIGASGGLGAALGDLDGDGDLDAFVAVHPNRVLLNQTYLNYSWEGKIVGLCEGATPPQICITQAQSGKVRQVTEALDFEYIDPLAAWSPDGAQIVFGAGSNFGIPGQHTNSLYIIREDGSDLRRLTDGCPVDGAEPAWSPDGQWIVFRRRNNLWVVRPDGSDERQILGGGTEFGPSMMVWSPDSQWIAFVDFSYDPPGVSVVRHDGSEPRTVYRPERSQDPGMVLWCPDGKRLVHAAETEDGEGRFALITLDGSKDPQLMARDTRERFSPYLRSWFHNHWPQWRGQPQIACPEPSAAAPNRSAQTLILQPGPEDGIDLQLPEGFAENYGQWVRLEVGSWAGVFHHSLIRFDVASQLPAGAIVDSATLSLYTIFLQMEASIEIRVHRVLEEWEEGTGQGTDGPRTYDGATWFHRRYALSGDPDSGVPWRQEGCSAAGTDFKKEAEDAAIPVDGWNDWSLSAALVQSWLDAPSTNYGLIITDHDARAGKVEFASSDYYDAEVRPRLEIRYHVPNP